MSSDLVFINTSGPDDSKSQEKRKAVRSQAAKDHSQSSSKKPEGSGRRRHRKLLSYQVDLGLYESEASGSGSPTPPNTESSSLGQEPLWDPSSTGYGIQKGDLDPTLGDATNATLNTMPGAGWTHPFVSYADKTSVPGTLSNYLSKATVDIPELNAAGAKSLLQSIWFPMVITDPATLDLLTLVMAAYHIFMYQTQGSSEALEQLKKITIASINRALKDPDLAISDQVIGAAAKMAAYEAGFVEDEEQYHIHMKGLTKMVELRGGLGSLGSSGMLARMLLFIDLNGAFLFKNKRYFSHGR